MCDSTVMQQRARPTHPGSRTEAPRRRQELGRCFAQEVFVLVPLFSCVTGIVAAVRTIVRLSRLVEADICLNTGC